MNAQVYIEGGGNNSKELHIRAREGFRKLLEKLELARMPGLTACGSRNNTFEDFQKAHGAKKPGDYIALLVDSEEPVKNIQRPWEHLSACDNWNQPVGTNDDQVFLMTTCMETWIAADHETLKAHFGQKLQESALPPLFKLEERSRYDVQDRLEHATRICPGPYRKGKRSFEVLGKLKSSTLSQHLPSFARMIKILKAKLKA